MASAPHYGLTPVAPLPHDHATSPRRSDAPANCQGQARAGMFAFRPAAPGRAPDRDSSPLATAGDCDNRPPSTKNMPCLHFRAKYFRFFIIKQLQMIEYILS